MNVKERPYNSYEELLDDLKPGQRFYDLQCNYIYRGHAIDWELVPLALRKEQWKNLSEIFLINSRSDLLKDKKKYDEITKNCNKISCNKDMRKVMEYFYLIRFYRYANEIGLKLPKTNLTSIEYSNLPYYDILNKLKSQEWILDEIVELAALAQHYGTPTRLLDWSFSIYVALYFASCNAVKMIINSEIENYKNINTDYLIIWALAHNMLEIETNSNPDKAPPIKFVIPNYSDNPNICAQKGILSYWKTPAIDVNEVPSSDYDICCDPLNVLLDKFNYETPRNNVVLYKIKIPISESLTILKHVSSLGYNASTLFPGYYGVKQKIDEDIMIGHAEHIFEEIKLEYTAARSILNNQKPSIEKMNKSNIDKIKKALSHDY